MVFLVSPIVAHLNMEDFEQKALGTDTYSPSDCGSGIWMTHLLSKRKITNKTSLNTLTVLAWS